MTNPDYGTAAFYASHFSDILSDVATEQSAAGNRQSVINIIRGFQMAIEEWLEYHNAAVTSYKQVRDEFLNYDPSLEEEDNLPPIPEFPSVLK